MFKKNGMVNGRSKQAHVGAPSGTLGMTWNEKPTGLQTWQNTPGREGSGEWNALIGCLPKLGRLGRERSFVWVAKLGTVMLHLIPATTPTVRTRLASPSPGAYNVGSRFAKEVSVDTSKQLSATCMFAVFISPIPPRVYQQVVF